MNVYLIDEGCFDLGTQRDTWLLYAPVMNRVVRINAAAAKQIAAAMADGTLPKEPTLAELWTQISNAERKNSTNPQSTALSAAKSDAVFCPTQVTLFLTNTCQLRCVYCYARAGDEKPSSMPISLAKAAVDFVIKNAVSQKRKTVKVTFHGGGEPSLKWALLTEVTLYAQTKARFSDLKVELSVGTNGILTEEQCEWMARNFKHITVSLDGPPDIQDVSRPLAGGGPSSHVVERSIKYFARCKTQFSIRATITEKSVERQEEFILHLSKLGGVSNVQFQPMWPSGRGSDTEGLAPNWHLFVLNFVRAKELANKKGVRLSMAGTGEFSLRLDGRFCGAAGSNFAVTPQGRISACYEALDELSEGASPFFYGEYDQQSETFVVDSTTLARLRDLNAFNRKACEGCFCLLTCAGNCPIKVLKHGKYETAEADDSCQMMRALTLHGLQMRLNTNYKKENQHGN